MGFGLILSVILLVIAVWLWHTAQAKAIHFSVDASLAPTSSTFKILTRETSKLKIWYQRVRKRLLCIFEQKRRLTRQSATLSYQGRLANAKGELLNGTFEMVFAIYDAQAGGKRVWGPEKHSTVLVKEGLFQVTVGSQKKIIPNKVWKGDRYWEIAINGETLQPRELIRSVPIAGLALTIPDGSITGAQLKNFKTNYRGSGQFPRQVYEGDSKNICVDLKPSFLLPEIDIDKSLAIQKSKRETSIMLQVLQNIGFAEYLEFELMSAGFVVEGDKKQKQPLSSNHLRYQWNCYFPNSGRHTYILAVRTCTSSNTIEIGRIEQTVRVTKIAFLTQRQVWILASLTGLASGILAIAEVLRNLGLW